MGEEKEAPKEPLLRPAPTSELLGLGPGVALPTRCVFLRETPSEAEDLRPKVAAKSPDASASRQGPATLEPGSLPGSRPRVWRPLPTAPPRGLRPKPSAPALQVASRSQPFRVAYSPRVKDVAGDGQVPGPGYHPATQHKNALARAK